MPACVFIRVAVLALVLGSGPALAHKLNVFAAADGARIQGSAYFAGGGKAAGVLVRITDAAGTVLAELRTAADGSFGYHADAPVEHRIIAETVDGHRAQWRVGADELAPGFPASAAAPRPVENARPQGGGESPAITSAADGARSAGPALSADLEAAIERAVARQIGPLRRELAEARDARQLQDILGGIGYIVGLAGLALWWQARRPRKNP
jgi:nickel transport protein